MLGCVNEGVDVIPDDLVASTPVPALLPFCLLHDCQACYLFDTEGWYPDGARLVLWKDTNNPPLPLVGSLAPLTQVEWVLPFEQARWHMWRLTSVMNNGGSSW